MCPKRGFAVEDTRVADSLIQLADGGFSDLLGKVCVAIKIGTEEETETWREFYILKDLTCNILLGEEFLESISAFQSYSKAFQLDDEGDRGCEINPIVWLKLSKAYLSRIIHTDNIEQD